MRTTQEEINRHFIRMAEGHPPEIRGKLHLFTAPQSGKGNGRNDRVTIRMVTPTAQAVEQAKSDLKRGLGQTTNVLDEALERDAKRKKLSMERKARRRKAKYKTTKKKKKKPVKTLW